MTPGLVTVRGANGLRLELKPAWIRDGLAVTRALNQPGYALTHVRTGTRVAGFRVQVDAIGCAKAIATLARWTSERPLLNVAAPERQKINEAIAAFEGTR